MTYLEQAIQKACDHGYKDSHIWGIENGEYILMDDSGQRVGKLTVHEMLLDPTWWQALGRGLGWSDTFIVDYTASQIGHFRAEDWDEWEFHWHDLITHLAANLPLEDFFKSLLTT